MAQLAAYLAELREAVVEAPIEPELKPNRQQLDKQIREDHDLAAGAVLVAVLEKGDGNVHPKEGDMVYVHLCIYDDEETLLYSTRSSEGGSGQAYAFLYEKGTRVPRAWELALRGMVVGQRCMVQAKPQYGFRHPECRMEPPSKGIPTNQALRFDMSLVALYDAGQVHGYGVVCAAGAPMHMYKRMLKDGGSLEAPRAPNEITLHVSLHCPAYDGIQLSGKRFFTTRGKQPLTLTLGQRQLPQVVEEALGWMSKGESAVYVLPAHLLAHQGGASSGTGLLPAPPAKCLQVEVHLELLSLVQVRDVTGTGEVLKKRVREGTGEFPVDCPLHDTTLRLHYRTRAAAGGKAEPGPWAYDSRAATPDGQPLEVDSGCGELPEGLELVLKLMVPGELALANADAAPGGRYGYQGRDDCPAGLAEAVASGSGRVEWEVELVDFEREGFWQNLTMAERYTLTERLKAKANELFKRQRYEFARARYTRLLRLLESTRDFETDDEVAKITAYQVAVLGNLSLCALATGDAIEAVRAATKALEHDADNVKMLFRLGKALSLKGEYEEAEEVLTRVTSLDSSLEKDVATELAANRQRSKAADVKQKRDFKSFFDR